MSPRRLHGSLRVGPLALSLAMLLAGCSSGGGSSSPAVVPDFTAASFTTPVAVNHPLFSFPAETTLNLATENTSEPETIVIERLPGTRVVMGVGCIRVRDRVYSEGLLIEDTEDWYAQDDAGNVWYMGEDVVNYEYDDDGNLLTTDNEGSWEAGLDIEGVGVPARPGFAMPANPKVGDFYYQEFYPGVAEDIGRVVQLDVPVTLADGSTYMCVKTRDTSALEPTAVEFKYYAPGVGFVLEEKPGVAETLQLRGRFVTNASSKPAFVPADFTTPHQIDHPLLPLRAETALVYLETGSEETETIVVERLPGTRMVAGVACAKVRDRVYTDGLLIEDTEDWFAQDDFGNVWYFGEEVVNHEYDDDGVLVSTDSGGSWESGLDVAGVGSIAEPGYQLPASLVLGSSYYQEFYEGEAEDMGLAVASGVTVTLPGGRVLTGCLRTLDWNPLEPDGLEYKLYAPGIGLVREEALHEARTGSLIGMFDRSAASIPDFAGASFTMSTLIDHPYYPLPAGGSWEYEAETDEGTETVLIEVLPRTRVVAGVTCRVVRDRVFLDGVIVEDTHDWFAQDDAGNVWYFGEEVVNFEYDDSGVLLGTNDDGSWEAGLDVAGAGSIAEPGFQFPASPLVGSSYYQEYYADEAEDMGQVIATGVTVSTTGGATYTNCAQLLDWNPLDPDGLEYKFYAPGIGLVVEQKLHEDGRVDLTEASL